MLLLLILIVLAVVFYILWSKAKKSMNWSSWFSYRDSLPQSNLPIDQWYLRNWNHGWGPRPSVYPIPNGPSPDIVTVARHYIDLPYRHHHIPAWDPPTSLTGKPNESPGLDCSNFTSWVYNYGKGNKFTSDIHKQAEMYKDKSEMIRIDDFNSLQPGDLLYFWRIAGNSEREISHTGIFSGIEKRIPYLIDSHGEGVNKRPMNSNSWYFKHFSHAIRIL